MIVISAAAYNLSVSGSAVILLLNPHGRRWTPKAQGRHNGDALQRASDKMEKGFVGDLLRQVESCGSLTAGGRAQ